MRATPLLTAITALALVVAGCSGDDDSTDNGDSDAAERLATAAELLDSTVGVRFALEGDNLPDSGNVIVEAEGVAAPPASLAGDIRVITSGLTTTIEVVSVDGDLWALLPLTSDFAKVDPTVLGFSDPGALIDPERGVSRLLTASTDVQDAGQVRDGAEVFDQITSTLPGDLVGELFAIVDPDADVDVTWSIDADTGHLRQAILTGPFYDTGDTQTYTVTLDDYDQPVDISAPED